MDSRRAAERYQRAADQTAPEWVDPPTRWYDFVGPALVGILAGWVLWPLVLG